MIRPLGELIGHLEVDDDMPSTWTPIAAIAVFQAMDEDGDTRWCLRITRGITDTIALGALVQAVELVKRDAIALWDGE